MIRLFDLFLSATGILLLLPLMLLLCVIGCFDTGSPLFLQQRVGRNQKTFTLVKFRTMKKETVSVATHLVDGTNITPFGHFLRKSKLDELPQLWNVLRGEMALVGPRPCLPSQHELIEERKSLGVLRVRPGVTGLAQINGIDMSEPYKLAKIDAEMLASLTVSKYFYYIACTVTGKGRGDRVRL